MATKTITIDLDAYRRLSRAKRDGESFSQVIKRVVPMRIDYKKWSRSLRDALDEEALDTVERRVRKRSARSTRER